MTHLQFTIAIWSPAVFFSTSYPQTATIARPLRGNDVPGTSQNHNSSFATALFENDAFQVFLFGGGLFLISDLYYILYRSIKNQIIRHGVENCNKNMSDSLKTVL